jgi:S1-C subfamily serine protease
MSRAWIVGVTTTAAVAAVMVAMVTDLGTTIAAAAAPAAAAPRAATAPAKQARTPATSTVVAAAAKAISPATVDVLTSTPTGNAAGTGIVLTAAGEVLTNYHVVRDATRISATDVATGRIYPATLVGYVAAEDIALLRLTGATGLPTAHLATSAAASGQTVIAVGNAEGHGGIPARVAGTVTRANRSVIATDRAGGTQRLTGMLQTTAPIVPGYSGGPLVDTAGHVVGMDTCGTFPSPDKPATAAFAIPISTAMRAVTSIRALPSSTMSRVRSSAGRQ